MMLEVKYICVSPQEVDKSSDGLKALELIVNACIIDPSKEVLDIKPFSTVIGERGGHVLVQYSAQILYRTKS